MSITETDRIRAATVPLQLNADKEIHLRFTMLSSDALERRFNDTSPLRAFLLPISWAAAARRAEPEPDAEPKVELPERMTLVEHLTFMIAIACLHPESGAIDAGKIEGIVEGTVDLMNEVARIRRQIAAWMADPTGRSYYNGLVRAIDLVEQLPLCANDAHGQVCGHDWSEHDWNNDRCSGCECQVYRSSAQMAAQMVAAAAPPVADTTEEISGKAPAATSTGNGSTTPPSADLAAAPVTSG